MVKKQPPMPPSGKPSTPATPAKKSGGSKKGPVPPQFLPGYVKKGA